MKNKIVTIFALCAVILTMLTASASSAKPDIPSELQKLLNDTKKCVDLVNTSKEDSSSLSLAWNVIATLLDQKENFVTQSIAELGSGLAKVRPQDKLPAWTPLHVLFGASKPEELTSDSIEKTFNKLTHRYELLKTYEGTDNKVLTDALTTVNEAFVKAGIKRLKIDDQYAEFIKLVRQSCYVFMQPFGIARYQSYQKDVATGDKKYTNLTAFQKEFQKACSQLSITMDDCVLYAHALQFIQLPKEDEGALSKASKNIEKKLTVSQKKNK